MSKRDKRDSEVEENAWAGSAELQKPKQKKARRKKSTQHVLEAKQAKDNESTARLVAVAAQLPTASPIHMPVARALPILVCSIGNPGSTYANTLHSAGHTVLNRLAQHLGYPPFRKDRSLGNGLVSNRPPSESVGEWTLWQSSSYMNESGKGVRAAWMAWSRNLSESQGKLVIVHDELEKPLGAVTLRTAPGGSAKGHNGLKSILSVMGNAPFARIGIGIGRPTSRESDDVARYVLQKMKPEEKTSIEECVQDVVAKLTQLEMG